MGAEEFTRTDLACEWGKGIEMDGTRSATGRWLHGQWETLRICTPEAAARMGRAQGEYVTVSGEAIWRLEKRAQRALEELIARVLVRLLEGALGHEVDRSTSVLVVGLGNRDITADALGPMAVNELLVTRHLRRQEPAIFEKMDCCSVAALAPGVLGQTGMEATEVIAGAVRRCGAQAVVAIDALAARSCDRLAATVQLSNTGISPGAGIGNDRASLSLSTLGVPVIAVGIPTVVDSSTLVYDALRRAGIDQIDERLRQILENGRRFYVSPKEADQITARTASLLARAINRALIGVADLHG